MKMIKFDGVSKICLCRSATGCRVFTFVDLLVSNLKTDIIKIVKKHEIVVVVCILAPPLWGILDPRVMLLHYRLATTHNQRLGMCWQQFTVSPASSEWLKDNVSMNFPIDTIPSSYVWSMLRTLEWLSQVLESRIQRNAIVTYYCERHLRVSHVFSCLFRQVYISQCKFHIIS